MRSRKSFNRWLALMNADSFQRKDAEGQRISTTDEHRWTRIFTEAFTPLAGLIMEETFLGWRYCASSVVVSASYDRFSNGACVPVQKLGSKTLG